MSQSPQPQDHSFLSKTVESVKDMKPPLRFAIVFFALFIFALLFRVVIPNEFVPLVYLLSVGVLLLYLFWEWQQHQAATSQRQDERLATKDVLDHDLKKAELPLKYEERKSKRQHELELRRLEQDKASLDSETVKKKEP